MKLFRTQPNAPTFPKLKQVTNKASGKRLYVTPAGKKYPSITTILQEYSREGITAWRNKVGAAAANAIAAKAGQRGTRIHSLCEKYLNNQDPITSYVSIFDKILFQSLVPLLHEIDNIHIQEQRLYSDYLRVAGTVDCIAEHNGRLSVIDFKTSSRRKQKDQIENYFMQCSAYAIMYEERTGIPIDKIVLMIACDNDPPQLFVEKRDNYVDQLLYYRDLYEKNHPNYLDDILDGFSDSTGEET
jgi:genome maintenance exonuclease 1